MARPPAGSRQKARKRARKNKRRTPRRKQKPKAGRGRANINQQDPPDYATWAVQPILQAEKQTCRGSERNGGQRNENGEKARALATLPAAVGQEREQRLTRTMPPLRLFD